MITRLRERGSAARFERGVSVVSTAIVMPLLLMILVVCFDLARLYINGIFAQEVAILTAKLACSGDPNGYAMPDSDVQNLALGAPEESTGDVNTYGRRQKFWVDVLSPGSTKYSGKIYFTDKEKKVLNLAYGYARELNPRIYFPIPEGLGEDKGVEALGGRPNCSIYFKFAPNSTPPATLPASNDATYEAVMSQDRDRIIFVDCAVPLIALSLNGIFEGPSYRVVSRSAYAYRSGNIKRAG